MCVCVYGLPVNHLIDTNQRLFTTPRFQPHLGALQRSPVTCLSANCSVLIDQKHQPPFSKKQHFLRGELATMLMDRRVNSKHSIWRIWTLCHSFIEIQQFQSFSNHKGRKKKRLQPPNNLTKVTPLTWSLIISSSDQRHVPVFSCTLDWDVRS